MRPKLVKTKMSLAARVGLASVSCVVLMACSSPANPSSMAIDTGSTPVASPTSVAVTLHGVSIALPSGWSEGAPTVCGPVVAKTVTVYTGAPKVAPCPSTASSSKSVEAVSLVEVFGPWGALPWSGTKSLWDGQPAWITEYDSAGAPVTPCLSASSATDCPSSSSSNELLTTTVTLPWLNAAIVVRAATAAGAREFLSHVSVHAEPDLGVPASASRMSITWATAYQRPRSSTSQADIEQTLAALRALPSLPVSAACEIPVYLGPAVGGKVVTFESNSTQISFLVAQSPCNQVISGTGTASGADDALYAALARVPLPVVR